MIHDYSKSKSTSNSKYITSNFNKMPCLVNNTTKHNTYCSFSTRHLSLNENGLWYLSAMLSIIDDKMTMMILVRIHSIYRHRYRSCLHATQQQQQQMVYIQNCGTRVCEWISRHIIQAWCTLLIYLFVCIHLSSGFKFHGILIEFIEAIRIQPEWAASSLWMPHR